MNHILVRPSFSPRTFRRILVSDDVWEPQAMDGVEKPEDFPFGDDSWIYAMTNEAGNAVAFLVFAPKGQGIYEQHSCVPEQYRESWDSFIKDAHRAMFLQTDATMLITLCPDWMPLLVKVCGRFGGKKMWHRERIGTRGGKPYGAQMMGLTVMDWAWRVHPEFVEAGHEWHEAAFADGAQHHDDDRAHDGFVGLALAMSVHYPSKAQQVYNTWARTAGYWPLTTLWAEDGNSLIDIGSSIILNKGGKFAASLSRQCPPQPPS